LLRIVLSLLIWFTLCSPARAHAPGEHYVWIGVGEETLEGMAEINARDLRDLLGYDVADGGKINDAALAPYRTALRAYFLENFSITDSAGKLAIDIQSVRARSFAEGEYAAIDFTASASGLGEDRVLTFRDELLFEHNPRHRGLLLITHNDYTGARYRERTALVFSRYNTEQTVDLDRPPGLLSMRQFVWQGMVHIWSGLDHVLFLSLLLLTAVLSRGGGEWRPVAGFAGGAWNVLKIVTLFTVAHSITLLLAGLGWITLPSRWVEAMIALSIIVVAWTNLFGRFDSKKAWVVVVFGLFHGLGFATVMSELPFRMQDLMRVVLYFNVGVELGQVAIVLLVFPLAFYLRDTWVYRRVILQGGSAVVAGIAVVWLLQRILVSG